MLRSRAALLASTCLLSLTLVPSAGFAANARAGGPAATAPAGVAVDQGGTIAAIQVTGNQRIESSTIASYLVVQPGAPFNQAEIDRSLKSLYATGLFSSVSITRQGNDLVVAVVENPTVAQVFFRGNHEVEDKDIQTAISLKSRSVFTATAAEADRATILGLYAKKGYYDATVTPEIVRLPDNRVNVVFNIVDGNETLISRIDFVGNRHFSQGTLRTVVSSRESAWWRFLSSSDQYNPDRVQYDEQLLRQFYLHHGYADFQVQSADAELAPDRRSFYLTFDLDEGVRYRVSSLTVNSSINHLSTKDLVGLVPLAKGDWFDGDALEEGIKAISTRVENQGFAFAQVEPEVHTDPVHKTISITIDVIEGPHVYIQRIDITGNTRTEDKVIRREMQLAEGDAYNQDKVDQSKENLKNLGFFKTEDITTSPGSQPNQVIMNTKVQEEATGEFSLGGGYSTDLGALANVGLSQNNFLGTGVNASISGLLAQRGTEINLGVTDPYFLDRNLIAGFDLFRTVTDSYTAAESDYAYAEATIGGDLRLGYRFNNHVRQSWTYTLEERDVYDIQSGASLYVYDEAGISTLSQISQTTTFDYLDDDINPTSGTLVTLTTDYAGLGFTTRLARFSANASYYIPLEHVFGDKRWVLEFSAGGGYMVPLFGYQSRIIDRFFLGGDNLRGFADGGVGPHDVATGDTLGGNILWTQSTELHFPLPVSPDLGISGFAFVDTGSTWGGVKAMPGEQITDSSAPRVAAGVGVSWNTPFGLINLSLAEPVVKQRMDQIQQFRVSFGTRF